MSDSPSCARKEKGKNPGSGSSVTTASFNFSSRTAGSDGESQLADHLSRNREDLFLSLAYARGFWHPFAGELDGSSLTRALLEEPRSFQVSLTALTAHSEHLAKRCASKMLWTKFSR